MPRLPVFVPLVLATGLLLAGCGSSSSTADSPAVVPPSGAASGAPSAAAAPGAQHSSAASAGASGAPSAAASGSQQASVAPSASGAAAGQSPAAVAVPLPPAGSYTYAIRGSSTSALGSQRLTGDSSLTVESLSPTKERSTQRDKSGSTEQTMVARSGGLYLAEIHLTQTGLDEDFKPAKPVLLFPASAHRGQHWTWHMTSTDGKFTLTAQLSVTDLHSSATTTGGQRYNTVTLTSVLHLHSSDIDATINMQDEASRDAVIVHEHSVSDGTAYGTKFHSNVTRVLDSRPS